MRNCSEECYEAYKHLKDSILTDSVLVISILSKHFQCPIDESETAVGEPITQLKTKRRDIIIAFF